MVENVRDLIRFEILTEVDININGSNVRKFIKKRVPCSPTPQIVGPSYLS
jgi:hypothetical protein